jgi:hypothetical protein
MHPAACTPPSLGLHTTSPNPPQMITSTSCLSGTMPLTSLMRSKQTNVLALPFFPSSPHTTPHRIGVNVSFIDVNTTNWASISGVAKVHNDKKLIETLWSPLCVTPFPSLRSTLIPATRSISGYFSDLGDGVHKGDKNDPRVSVIEVIPDEVPFFLPPSLSTYFLTAFIPQIRYWVATSGALGRAVEHAKGIPGL